MDSINFRTVMSDNTGSISPTDIYLKEKYGTSDFEILDIDRKFSANGLVATNSLEYYDVNVLYKQSNIFIKS